MNKEQQVAAIADALINPNPTITALPNWLYLYRAARALNCAPSELYEAFPQVKPVSRAVWVERVAIVEQAEAQAALARKESA